MQACGLLVSSIASVVGVLMALCKVVVKERAALVRPCGVEKRKVPEREGRRETELQGKIWG